MRQAESRDPRSEYNPWLLTELRTFPEVKTRRPIDPAQSIKIDVQASSSHAAKAPRGPAMRTLIVYGSTQGQTQKITDFVAGRWRGQDHDVAVFDARAVTSIVDP